MSASRMTWAHFAPSFLKETANSGGELGAGSISTRASALLTSGALHIRFISVLNLATIYGLTSAGTNSPHQVITTSSGMPDSAVVGALRSAGTRSYLPHHKRAVPAAF